jgi:hypothetical protein
VFTGTALLANNSSYLGGNLPSYYANVTAPSFTTSVSVGSNVSLTTSQLIIGNSTVNTTVNSTVFSGIANNSTNFAGQGQSYYANVTAPVFSVSVNVGSNVSLSTSALFIGNSTINTTINSSAITNAGNVTSNTISLVNLTGPAITAQVNTGVAGYFIANNATTLIAISNGTANTFTINSAGTPNIKSALAVDLNVQGFLVTADFNDVVFTTPRALSASELFFRNHSLNANSTGGDALNGVYGNYVLGYNGLATDGTTAENTYIDIHVGTYNELRNYSNNPTLGANVMVGTRNLVRTFNSVAANLVGTWTQLQIGNTSSTANVGSAYGSVVSIGTVTANSNMGNTYMYYGLYTASANITGSKYGVWISGEANNYLSANLTVGVALAVGANATLSTSTLSIGNSTVNAVMNSTVIVIGNSTVNTITNSTSFNGTANNSTNFAGQGQSFYANVTAPVFSVSVNVGSNVSLSTSTLTIGNSTVNTTINSSALSITTISTVLDCGTF